jgi:hypothetical protein
LHATENPLEAVALELVIISGALVVTGVAVVVGVHLFLEVVRLNS